MSDQEPLLAEFIAAWHAGRRPDPDEFLSRAHDEESEKALAKELALFLELAQEPSYSTEDLRAIRERPEVVVAAAAYRDTAAASELVQARESRGLSLTDLARALLRSVGMDTTPERTERATEHLGRLEAGLLPVEGLTGHAVAALRDLLKVDLTPPSQPATVLFRQAERTRGDAFDVLLDAIETPAASNPEAEVDRLFFGDTGGAA